MQNVGLIPALFQIRFRFIMASIRLIVYDYEKCYYRFQKRRFRLVVEIFFFEYQKGAGNHLNLLHVKHPPHTDVYYFHYVVYCANPNY